MTDFEQNLGLFAVSHIFDTLTYSFAAGFIKTISLLRTWI